MICLWHLCYKDELCKRASNRWRHGLSRGASFGCVSRKDSFFTEVLEEKHRRFRKKMASNYLLTNVSTDQNESLTALCPIHSESEKFWNLTLAYWLDGVIKTIVASIGVFSNILAGHVLVRPKMRNSFNFCLVALNIIDVIFLIGAIQDSFQLR